MAKIHFELNKYTESKQSIELALEIFNRITNEFGISPELVYKLQVSYMVLGDIFNAREDYSKALDYYERSNREYFFLVEMYRDYCGMGFKAPFTWAEVSNKSTAIQCKISGRRREVLKSINDIISTPYKSSSKSYIPPKIDRSDELINLYKEIISIDERSSNEILAADNLFKLIEHMIVQAQHDLISVTTFEQIDQVIRIFRYQTPVGFDFDIVATSRYIQAFELAFNFVYDLLDIIFVKPKLPENIYQFIMFTLEKLSDMNVRLGRYEEAAGWSQFIIDVKERQFPIRERANKENQELLFSYKTYGALCYKAKLYELAEHYFNKCFDSYRALESSEAINPKNKFIFAHSLILMGKVVSKIKSTEESLVYQKEFVELYIEYMKGANSKLKPFWLNSFIECLDNLLNESSFEKITIDRELYDSSLSILIPYHRYFGGTNRSREIFKYLDKLHGT